MTYRIKVRRSPAAAWTAANPVLASGEIGFETDTGKFKIGDGTTTWALLYYFKNSNDSTLNDMSEVAIATPTADQSLVYDGTVWVNKATTFVHTQSSASASWTVTHNLGYYPGGVSVIDSGENVVIGDIIHSTDNAFTINFSSAFSGKAYVS